VQTVPNRDETKRVPTRTCVGCGQRNDAEEMVRLVLDGTGVAFDLAGGAFGRGAHVHARPECIEKAARGGLARSFRSHIETTPEQMRESLGAACDRRMAGLLLAARRIGEVAVGADAAREALRKGAPLVVVAVDAGAIASDRDITGAAAQGRAIAWKTKDELGALLGGGSVAVCSICHAGIAAQLAATRRLEGQACCSRFPEAR
jgi:predicted RNA-binding protein YlxR (DUF448 family)